MNGQPSDTLALPLPVNLEPDLAAAQGWTPSTVFRSYRWRILLTYGLFNLENLLRLAQPWALGLAIGSLLQSSYLGLAAFGVQHFGYVLLSAWRRTYDTRTFSLISTDLATRLVLEQRNRQVTLSRIAARSALSREMVDFFERVLPVLVDVIYSVVGALVMLAVYDWVLVPLAAGLFVPVCVLSYSFGRAALKLNRELNDELEREVAVINEGVREGVHEHYAHVRGIRIELNDRAAWNFGLLEGCAFVLMAIALIRCCSVSTGAEAAGPICAVFGYILIFSRNLTNVPLLIEQISRMRDIYRRMNSGEQQ